MPFASPQEDLPLGANSDMSLEVNRFRMSVPILGYRWLDKAHPLPEGGRENERRLNSSPPFMVMEMDSSMGWHIKVRDYEPFIDTPGLFQEFMKLELDRDSFLAFANRYGWIGHRGSVRSDGKAYAAVGIDTWVSEIQSMIVAERLIRLASKNDQHALREYLFWDPVQFDVWVEIGMDGRVMRPLRNRTAPAQRVMYNNWLYGLPPLNPETVSRLTKHGWRRGELTGPALGVVAQIVNARLGEFCHPALFVGPKLGGYWTAKNLLGCLWLQFYLKIIGQLKLRKCEICGKEMDVSNSRRSRRMHVRCSRNKRQAAWRSKTGPASMKNTKATKPILQH